MTVGRFSFARANRNARVFWHRTYSRLFAIRQRENVQRVTALRVVDVGQDRARDIPRAAAALSCGDGDILFAADAEGYREALHGSAEPNLPEGFSCVHVDGSEVAVEITHE